MEDIPLFDYSAIAKQCGATSIVGVGESTHGTHEFFQAKADLFKELVQNHGFNTLFLESIDDSCAGIDAYIQTGEGQLEDLVNKLFYVYRTEEILDLVEWLRKHHEQHPVRFVGIDERKYVDDYASDYSLDKSNIRDKRMASVVKKYADQNPGTKAMIWAHDTHVAAYIDPPEWAPDIRQIAMGEHLRNWFGEGYYSVAQLFGSGYFNAALIDESGKFDNSKLVRQYARRVSKWFWENALSKRLTRPTYLEGPDFAGLIEKDKALYKRALGWGVQRSIMHNSGNVTYVDMSKAFDAVIFFPRATASHLLVQKQ